MAIHRVARLAFLLILAGVTVAPTQAVAEPGAVIEPEQQKEQHSLAPVDAHVSPRHQPVEDSRGSESPPSPDGFVISNLSLVPHGREAETCVTDAGEDLSTSATSGDGAPSSPAGPGPGSCDVLVAAALLPEEYLGLPKNLWVNKASG